MFVDTNYRNTAQILDYAHGVIAGSEYADIEGLVAKGERPASAPPTLPCSWCVLARPGIRLAGPTVCARCG